MLLNYQKIRQQILKEEKVQLLLRLLMLTDYDAYEHSLRVMEITAEVLSLMQTEYPCKKHVVYSILTGAVLHDIGKSVIPFAIQAIPAKLTANEKEIIAIHANAGYELVHGILNDGIAENIILLHHKKQNEEHNLPFYVIIVEYADITDALLHKRAYKRAFTPTETVRCLKEFAEQELLPPEPIRYFEQYIHNT